MAQAGRAALLLACFSSLLVDCSALIPVIGWSNSDAFGSVKGNQFSNANEFIYDASLDNVDMVVIFKAPELSFDSLAKYGGVFGGKNPTMSSLQAEIKGSKSSAWVGVDGSVASDLIRTLSFIMGVDPHIITGADGLTSKHKLVQVELSPTSDNFSDQDDVISEVMSALHSLPESSSYAAMYTSSHTHIPRSSRDQEEDLVRRRRDAEGFRIPRAVDEDADTKEKMCAHIFSDSTDDDQAPPCLLFCFTDTNVTVVSGTGGNVIFNVTDLAFGGGSCDIGCGGENSSACLMVTGLKGTDGEREPITFQFTFPYGACVDKEGGSPNITCGFWTMEIYVNDIHYRRATEESKIFSAFLVPIGTSYACGDNDLNTYLPTNSNNTEGYKFKGLQVQLFSGITVQSTDPPVYVFGSAYHCQGYVNTISLMGLTAIIILVLILYCSVVFMFSIKTQDRFDDPRAPTISVENLH